jgi:hypothetical protein
VHEPCSGHRLDHATHRLAKLEHPARQTSDTIPIARRRELRDQLATLSEQANIDAVTTQTQAIAQHSSRASLSSLLD